MKMRLLFAIFTALLAAFSNCWGFEIIECVSGIVDPILRAQQINKYGPFDQYLFDNSPVLTIYGSGFDILKDKRLNIKLSGHAIQHRDFEAVVGTSTLELKLIGRSKWIEYFTEAPYQALRLTSITVHDMLESNLISSPVVVAFITEHPKIDPIVRHSTVNCSGYLMLTGKGLMGHENVFLQFSPPLTIGVDYEFESRFPLAENVLVLRTLPGRSWRHVSGPLYITGVSVPKVNHSEEMKWLPFMKVPVAVVQCGLYVPHQMDIALFTEDDLSIYHDQSKIIIQGSNLKGPFEFSNGMQVDANYSIVVSGSEEVVLRLIKPSSWSNDWSSYPQRLWLLSAGSVALGESGMGIVVAVVYRRPSVRQAFVIPVIQQTNTKVLYIEGSGYVPGNTQLSFSPPIPPAAFNITVMSNTLLEVALNPGYIWRGSNQQTKSTTLGYLYVNGISSRGDSGWRNLAPSAHHSQGILVGSVVSDIVDYGHVLPSTSTSTIGDANYILEGKPSSMLPIDDPFEWRREELPYDLSVESLAEIVVVGAHDPVLVCVMTNSSEILDGIFYRPVVASGMDQQFVGGNAWTRAHVDFSAAGVSPSTIGTIATSLQGKHLAALVPGREGFFVSLTYGQYWEHRSTPVAKSGTKLRGSTIAESLIMDVSLSAHGSLLSALCTKSEELHWLTGGSLLLSSDFGREWRKVTFAPAGRTMSDSPGSWSSLTRSVNPDTDAGFGVMSATIGGDGMFMIASLRSTRDGRALIARSWTYGETWDIVESSNSLLCRQLLFASPMSTAEGDGSEAITAATLSSLNVLCIDVRGRLWHSDSFGVSWSKAGAMAVDGEDVNTDSGDCRWDRVTAGQLGGYVAATVACSRTRKESKPAAAEITADTVLTENSRISSTGQIERTELVCISVNMGRTFSPLTSAPPSLAPRVLGLSVGSDHLAVGALGANAGLYVGSVDEAEGIEPVIDDRSAAIVEPRSRNASYAVEASPSANNSVVDPDLPAGINFTITRHSEFRPGAGHKRYYYEEPVFLHPQRPASQLDWAVRKARVSCVNAFTISPSTLQILCASHDRSFLLSNTLGRSWRVFHYDSYLDAAGASYPTLRWISGSDSFAHLTACFGKSTDGTVEPGGEDHALCWLYTSSNSGQSWHRALYLQDSSKIGHSFRAFKMSMSGQYQVGLTSIRKLDAEIAAFDPRPLSSDISYVPLQTEIRDVASYAEQMQAVFGPDSFNITALQYRRILDDHVKDPRSQYHCKFTFLLSKDYGRTFTTSSAGQTTLGKMFINEAQLNGASVALSDDGVWVFVALPFLGILSTSDFGMDGWKDSLVRGFRYRDISCSNNGKYVVASFGHSKRSDADALKSSNGGIMVSADYGNTWEIAAAPNMWFERVVVTGSGLVMYATAINCNDAIYVPCGPFDNPSSVSVYISTNFGRNWSLANRLSRQVDIGSTYLAVSPLGNKLAVYSRNGETILGSSVDIAATDTTTILHPFHFNFHMSQLNGESLTLHVFGAGFTNKVVTLNFESSFYNRGLRVDTVVINEYELDIRISKDANAAAVAFVPLTSSSRGSGDVTAVSYRLQSLSLQSTSSTAAELSERKIQSVMVDAILTILPEPTIAPGHTLLFESSVRELIIHGTGFVGPICVVELDPTPFGIYDCVILSNHMLQLQLRDDQYGYSDALGWLGVSYKWPYESDHVPLLVTHINFGAGKVPVNVNVGYIHRDQPKGVTTLKHFVDLPGSIYNMQFMRNASLFLALERANHSLYRSVNGRENWDSIGLPTDAEPQAFAAADTGKLMYLVSGDSIYRSYNTGKSWKIVLTVVGEAWRHVVCSALGKFALATGRRGSVVYTTSFGSTWSEASRPAFLNNQTCVLRNVRLAEVNGTQVVLYAIVRYVDSSSNSGSRPVFTNRLIVSDDQAKSWNVAHSALASVNVTSFECSLDCGVIAAITWHTPDLGLLLSHDRGTNWKAITFALSAMNNVAVSPDGAVVIVAGIDYNFELAVHISYNAGYSWARFQHLYSSYTRSGDLTRVDFAFDPMSTSLHMTAQDNNVTQLFVGATRGADYLQIVY